MQRVYAVDIATERLDPIPALKIRLDEISEVLGSEIDQFNPSALVSKHRLASSE